MLAWRLLGGHKLMLLGCLKASFRAQNHREIRTSKGHSGLPFSTWEYSLVYSMKWKTVSTFGT